MSANTPNIQSFTAGVDLTAKKYRFMRFSASRAVTFGTANHAGVFGILQNDPESGSFAEVAKQGGGSFLKLGGTVTFGDLLESNATGEGVLATGAGKHQVRARAMESGVLNDVIEVEVINMEVDI